MKDAFACNSLYQGNVGLIELGSVLVVIKDYLRLGNYKEKRFIHLTVLQAVRGA